MSKWSVEILRAGDDVEEVALGYARAFPHRSVDFFRGILKLVDNRQCKLYLLFADGGVRGAVLAFRVHGYDEATVWAPSYLYVDNEYRKFSIFFIAKAYSNMGPQVLCTSPTAEVSHIMRKLNYSPITKGSAIVPLFQAPLCWNNPLPKHNEFPISIAAFAERSDIHWFTGSKGPLAVKQAKRYGFTVFILSYFERNELAIDLPALLSALFLKAPHGMLLIPDRDLIPPKLLSLNTNKLALMANFKQVSTIISVLGSEITELT